eukprot:2551809-Pyramimonas_sp.AAC.1
MAPQVESPQHATHKPGPLMGAVKGCTTTKLHAAWLQKLAREQVRVEPGAYRVGDRGAGTL